MDQFLEKYLNITNKNNHIEITLLESYSENISNARVNIESFLSNLQSKHKFKYNINKQVIYKYNNNSIITSNNNNYYVTTKTIENNNFTFQGKKLNMAFKEILSSNPLISVNQYHDITSKEIFTVTLRHFDICISYDYMQKYGTINIVIKKPFQKKEILNSLINILDY